MLGLLPYLLLHPTKVHQVGAVGAQVVAGTPASLKRSVEGGLTDVSAVTAMVVYRPDEFRQVGDVLLRKLVFPVLVASAVGVVCLACNHGIYSSAVDYLLS